MRLFKSPWAYLFWLALFLNESWHELRPHTHPPLPSWHPLFNGVFLAFAELFCLCLMFSFARSTSNPLEKAALALLAIAFGLSIVTDIHRVGHFHATLPSFRLVFLVINALLALLTAIRFVQVLCDPALLPESSPTTND